MAEKSKIKKTILQRLAASDATWGEACGDVSRHMSVSTSYVERAMRELVSEGKVKRTEASRGMHQYRASEPERGGGAIEGKYRPFGERRLEEEEALASKSGTFEDNPWKRDINGPKAV